jgi:predicted transcriptional regulator
MNEAKEYCSTQLFKVRPGLDEIKLELNEHHFYLERNVALISDHLLKRIAVLESCHLTLTAKLARLPQGDSSSLTKVAVSWSENMALYKQS